MVADIRDHDELKTAGRISTSHDETKLKRTAGASGLAGTWEGVEVKVWARPQRSDRQWQGMVFADESDLQGAPGV